MNTNKLRLGNLIEVINCEPFIKNGITKVYSISNGCINHWQNGKVFGEAKENDIIPIPLTPEILEKAGFVLVGEKPFYSMRISVNSVDELCWYSQDNELRYQTKGSGFTRYFNTKYVHQLQNLYFALTGEELEIKL